MDQPNFITPAGYAVLRAEYDQLLGEERPRIVDVVAWAAGNGDRSENGDYIYGRKRLREIDRRLGWLAKRMQAARIVDPAQSSEGGAAAGQGAAHAVEDDQCEERLARLDDMCE